MANVTLTARGTLQGGPNAFGPGRSKVNDGESFTIDEIPAATLIASGAAVLSQNLPFPPHGTLANVPTLPVKWIVASQVIDCLTADGTKFAANANSIILAEGQAADQAIEYEFATALDPQNANPALVAAEPRYLPEMRSLLLATGGRQFGAIDGARARAATLIYPEGQPPRLIPDDRCPVP